MQVRIMKTEYGLAVPIPEEMLSAAGFKAEDVVNLYARKGWLEVADPSEPHYDIEEMVAQITEENRHPEVSTGPPVGREIW